MKKSILGPGPAASVQVNYFDSHEQRGFRREEGNDAREQSCVAGEICEYCCWQQGTHAGSSSCTS